MQAESLTASRVLAAWERGAASPRLRRVLPLLALLLDESEDVIASLPLGTRDRALLAARASLGRGTLEVLHPCRACGATCEIDLSALSELRPAPDGLDVELGARVVHVRAPSTLDLEAIANTTDVVRARVALVRRCTASELDDAETERVAAALESLDPLLDVELDLACPECGHRERPTLDLAEIVFLELADYGRRIFHDVHALASAYGWSERDILELGPVRRAIYLRMIDDG